MAVAPVHIEGMGVLGSLIAHRLDMAGIEFTWHDIDDEVNAWQACTGLVYPAGDDRSTIDRERWAVMVHNDRLAPFCERVAYWYSHKAPPHEGPGPAAVDLGWVRLSPAAAYQVDAPSLVKVTRQRFAERRLTTARTNASVFIVGHGFGQRLAGYMWGWTCMVGLAIPKAMSEASPLAPSIYGKDGRFGLCYAYKVPGADLWWAGSTLTHQANARRLDAGKHRDTWLRRWRQLFPSIEVMSLSPTIQGWRPKPAPSDTPHVRTTPRWQRKQQLLIEVPSLWHSGVRWAPTVVAEVMEEAQAWL